MLKTTFGSTLSLFFVFIFALALGAFWNAHQVETLAIAHCHETGGTWNDNHYCEKIANVCTPQAL